MTDRLFPPTDTSPHVITAHTWAEVGQLFRADGRGIRICGSVRVRADHPGTVRVAKLKNDGGKVIMMDTLSIGSAQIIPGGDTVVSFVTTMSGQEYLVAGVDAGDEDVTVSTVVVDGFWEQV